ncbi:MAG: hypothetical protein M1819_007046 [Sarea resinae]|nr:MAG: hypothetical protein M1819_007046 [Sarea resinae]
MGSHRRHHPSKRDHSSEPASSPALNSAHRSKKTVSTSGLFRHKKSKEKSKQAAVTFADENGEEKKSTPRIRGLLRSTRTYAGVTKSETHRHKHRREKDRKKYEKQGKRRDEKSRLTPKRCKTKGRGQDETGIRQLKDGKSGGPARHGRRSDKYSHKSKKHEHPSYLALLDSLQTSHTHLLHTTSASLTRTSGALHSRLASLGTETSARISDAASKLLRPLTRPLASEELEIRNRPLSTSITKSSGGRSGGEAGKSRAPAPVATTTPIKPAGKRQGDEVEAQWTRATLDARMTSFATLLSTHSTSLSAQWDEYNELTAQIYDLAREIFTPTASVVSSSSVSGSASHSPGGADETEIAAQALEDAIRKDADSVIGKLEASERGLELELRGRRDRFRAFVDGEHQG